MKITEIVMPSYANGGVGEYKVEVSLGKYSVRLWSQWQQDFFKSIIEKEVGSITVEELGKIEEITKLNWFDPVEEEYEATRGMDIYDYLWWIVIIFGVGVLIFWILPFWLSALCFAAFVFNLTQEDEQDYMSTKYAKSS